MNADPQAYGCGPTGTGDPDRLALSGNTTLSMVGRRAWRGAVNRQSGLAAEAAVEREYARSGCDVKARQWRGSGGELDLVLRDGPELVFVEVKRARSFARAAERLGAAQKRRIMATAGEYLATARLDLGTPMRFDVALVNGLGQISVIENALGW